MDDGSAADPQVPTTAVLTRRFDRRSPSVRRELEAFKHEVWALEQAVAPGVLSLHTRVQGDCFEVTLLSIPHVKSTS